MGVRVWEPWQHSEMSTEARDWESAGKGVWREITAWPKLKGALVHAGN